MLLKLVKFRQNRKLKPKQRQTKKSNTVVKRNDTLKETRNLKVHKV